MDRFSPILSRRALARELRELRDLDGRTIDQVADDLGWSKVKLARLEAGDMIKPVLREIERLAEAYGADEQKRAWIRDLALDARRSGWWTAFRNLPPEYSEFIAIETAAYGLESYEPGLIHGLLQTEAYTRALLDAAIPRPSQEEIDQRVAVRQERQRQLLGGPNPVRLWVLMGEAAITQQIGGRDVMRAQLQHLLAVARAPQVVVQVLPFTGGAVPLTEPFTVISLRDPSDSEIIYLELTFGPPAWFEDSASVALYQDRFTAIQSQCLPVKETLDLIAKRIGEI